MILYLLVIFAILFFLSWNLLANHRTFQLVAGIISTVLLIGAMIMVTANFHSHYGMNKVDHTRTSQLAPTSKDMNMLIYQPVGTAKAAKPHQVVVYKHTDDQKKTQHTDAKSNVYNYIKQDDSIKKPKLMTTTTKWEYKSSGHKAMFGIDEKTRVDKVTNTFYVPKDWNVFSAKQAQALPNIAKQQQANAQKQMQNPEAQKQQQQQAQSYIQGKMTQAMQKDPKMSDQDKQKLTKQLTTEYQNQVKAQAQAQMMPKIINEVKKVKAN